jgi:hypothetical protein
MKKNRRIIFPPVSGLCRGRMLMTLCLTTTLAGCAVNKNLQPAAATPSSGAGGFELADANHDGKLSRDEASDFLVNEIFTASDTDHNGIVTRKEATASDPTRLAEFEKRDLNKDGTLTRGEAIEYGRKHGVVNKMVREADKDHDKQLSKAEVQAYYVNREGPPR